MKQFLFEWKELIKQKAYPIFLMLTVLFVSSVYIYNYLFQEQIIAKKVEYFTELRQDVSGQNVQDQEKLKISPDPLMEEKLEVGLELVANLRELNSALHAKDWQGELTKEIAVYETALKYIDYDSAYFRISSVDMQREIELNEELLKRKLPKEDYELSIQTSIFMKRIISLVLNPIGFLMLLFLMGMLITREFEEHTIRLVYTLPVTRVKYMAIKFVSLLTAGILWLLLLFGVAYVVPEIFGSMEVEGNIFEYPLITSDGTYLNSGHYLQESILYSLCFVGFAIAVLLFLGYTLRYSIISYTILVIIFVGSWILSNYGLHFMYNPFTYQTIDQVVLEASQFYPIGAVVLLTAMVLLLMVTFITNRKRGI